MDGEQVLVPSVAQVEAGTAGVLDVGQGPASTAPGARVNLNTASAAELDALPGIGAATAQKIIDDRETNGPFARPEDLMRVPGIGESKFDALKDLVTTG